MAENNITITANLDMPSIGSVPFRTIEKALYKLAENPDINCDDLEVPFEYLVGSFFPNIMDNIHNAMAQQYIDGFKAGKEANK